MEPEKPLPDYSLWELISHIWTYARKYRLEFAFAVLLKSTSEIAALYPAYALGMMTTFFTTYKPGEPLTYFMLIMALWLMTSIYRSLAGRLADLKGFQAGEKMSLDAKMVSLQHAFSLDLGWHEKDYAGSKMQRILTGAQGMNTLIRLLFTDLIGTTISILGTALIMFSLDWELGLTLFLFSATYYVISFALIRRATKQLRIVQKRREDSGGINFESMTNISLIKSMDLTKPVLERLEKANQGLTDETVKLISAFRTREAITSTYAVLLKFAILVYIGYGIYRGQLQVGVFVMFYAYFDQVMRATAGMSRVTDSIIEEKVSVSRLKELMDEKPTVEFSGTKQMPDDWKEITVRNVSFSYSGKPTIKDISFTVRRGEKLGIVGPTGAGKSTIFKLMLKLDETYAGDIMIDQTPLREISRRSYIKKIAVVPQETEVFNATLKENVEITGPCGQKIENAIEMANLKELVERLPAGENTIIGEKGVKLSGGEKQRLSIARAFHKCPGILFLDEPTSQLDANSELKIQDSLKKVFKEVTAVVIAHRLSTIKEMDTILVLDNGTVVEEGAFDELIGKKGLFHSMWQKQKL